MFIFLNPSVFKNICQRQKILMDFCNCIGCNCTSKGTGWWVTSVRRGQVALTWPVPASSRGTIAGHTWAPQPLWWHLDINRVKGEKCSGVAARRRRMRKKCGKTALQPARWEQEWGGEAEIPGSLWRRALHSRHFPGACGGPYHNSWVCPEGSCSLWKAPDGMGLSWGTVAKVHAGAGVECGERAAEAALISPPCCAWFFFSFVFVSHHPALNWQ